jgi:hypothetical protein
MKKTTHLLSLSLNIFLLGILFTSCNQFGKEVKIKNSTVYYKDVSEADAKEAGNFFYNIGYFTDSNKISVQITKPKDTLQVRFVVDKEKVKPELEESFLIIASALSDSVFNKAPINVFLSDTDLKDIKRLGVASPTNESAAANNNNESIATNPEVEAILREIEQRASSIAGNVKEAKGNKLYYDNNVDVARVNTLVTYLDEGGYFTQGSGHIAILLKKGNSYILKEAFIDDQIKNKTTTDALEQIAASIKQDVFATDSFTFEVCNINFEPQMSFTPGGK